MLKSSRFVVRELPQWLTLITVRACLLALITLSSCSGPEASKARKAYGTALKPGEVLEFKNPNGSGKVHWVSEFQRRYDVLGGSSDVTLVQEA